MPYPNRIGTAAAVVMAGLLAGIAWAASPMWPGSLYTWSGAAKYCAATGAGGTLWDSCTVDDPDCGTSPPAGACVATIIYGDFDQVAEEVEALEAHFPTGLTDSGATHVVTADGAGTSGDCMQWGASGEAAGSGEPCIPTLQSQIVVANLQSTTDHIGLIAAPPGGETYRLVSVWCHCHNGFSGSTIQTVTTDPTLTFKDRGGNAVDITGGGALTCADGAAVSTATTFDTSDAHRDLSPGEQLYGDVTNTPSTVVNCSFGFIYSLNP